MVIRKTCFGKRKIGIVNVWNPIVMVFWFKLESSSMLYHKVFQEMKHVSKNKFHHLFYIVNLNYFRHHPTKFKSYCLTIIYFCNVYKLLKWLKTETVSCFFIVKIWYYTCWKLMFSYGIFWTWSKYSFDWHLYLYLLTFISFSTVQYETQCIYAWYM